MKSGRDRVARLFFFPPLVPPPLFQLLLLFSWLFFNTSVSHFCGIRARNWKVVTPLCCLVHLLPRGISELSGTHSCLHAWGLPVFVLSSTAVQPLYSSPFQTLFFARVQFYGAAVHVLTLIRVQAPSFACGPQMFLPTALHLLKIPLLEAETR